MTLSRFHAVRDISRCRVQASNSPPTLLHTHALPNLKFKRFVRKVSNSSNSACFLDRVNSCVPSCLCERRCLSSGQISERATRCVKSFLYLPLFRGLSLLLSPSLSFLRSAVCPQTECCPSDSALRPHLVSHISNCVVMFRCRLDLLHAVCVTRRIAVCVNGCTCLFWSVYVVCVTRGLAARVNAHCVCVKTSFTS